MYHAPFACLVSWRLGRVSPEIGATVSCEPPSVEAGNQTWALKSSTLNSLAISSSSDFFQVYSYGCFFKKRKVGFLLKHFNHLSFNYLFILTTSQIYNTFHHSHHLLPHLIPFWLLLEASTQQVPLMLSYLLFPLCKQSTAVRMCMGVVFTGL